MNKIIFYSILCLNFIGLAGVYFLLPVCLICDYLLYNYMNKLSDKEIYQIFFIDIDKTNNSIISDMINE